MAQQPSGMVNDNGVILTIGSFCNGEAFEIVQPIVTNSTALNPASICFDAVTSWQDQCVSEFLAILSSAGHLAFIAAEGMVNGRIPWRVNFAPSGFPGAAATPSNPTNVCAIGGFYSDPQDLLSGSKTRVAKSFFGGIARVDIEENSLTSDLSTRIATYINHMQIGFTSDTDPSSKWYRVIATPKSRVAGQAPVRSITAYVGAGVYTQKRRLVPRP